MAYTNSYEVKLQIRTQTIYFLGLFFYFIEEKIYIVSRQNEPFSEWNVFCEI